MYLNVNLANASNGAPSESSGSLGAGAGQHQQHQQQQLQQPVAGMIGSCTTPRTPDILNLLAPFDNIASFGPNNPNNVNIHSSTSSFFQPSASSAGGVAGLAAAAASTPGDGPSSPGDHASSSFSSFSSLCSSPATPSTPPGSSSSAAGLSSIQNTRSYLIKEGLKLTIQSKRLASGRGSLETDQLLLLHTPLKDEMGQLTTEDEERRRRRRERNKVAATKCRNRKKERTGILMQESDALEDQNVSFRSEIQRLESEKRRLMDVLAMHSPNCLKTAGANSQQTTPVSSCSSDYVHNHDPGNNSQQQGSSHYGTMPSTLSTSSSNYGQMYDCRTSSENATMGASHPHHSGYDLVGTPSEPSDFNPANEITSAYSQVNNLVQHHRLPYSGGGDNHPSYR